MKNEPKYYGSLAEHAKEAEKRNDWHTAKAIWENIVRWSDAAACQLIIDSGAKGDEYREKIKGLSQSEAHEIYIGMFLPHLLNK